MSAARSLSEAVERLSRGDATLKQIYLNGKHTDAQLAKLVDCLLARADAVEEVSLGDNRLTDETGVKLARYLAASSAIRMLGLSYNRFGEATFLAVAAALRVNSSLRILYLFANQTIDRTRIDAAFVEALRLNSNRPADSNWLLYSFAKDFKRLKDVAEQMSHPSMLQLLALLC